MDEYRDIISEDITKLEGQQEAAVWRQRLGGLYAKCPKIEVPVELYSEYEA